MAGNRIGILDVNGRGKLHSIKNTLIVKEEFECNEVFTPDMNMPRIFDQTVRTIVVVINLCSSHPISAP